MAFGLDGEYLEPFCKAERRASSPSPSLPGSGYDSSAGSCLESDAIRGPLSRAARARAPASRARTWLSKDATRPRLAACCSAAPPGQLAEASAPSAELGKEQPQGDGGGGAEQQDVPTTRIDRDGRRLLYQLSPLHFPPPTTSLLSDEDMCMCIHNKPVGCLAGPSLSPPDSKVIRPLSGRCLRPPATASHFAPRRLSIFVSIICESS